MFRAQRVYQLVVWRWKGQRKDMSPKVERVDFLPRYIPRMPVLVSPLNGSGAISSNPGRDAPGIAKLLWHRLREATALNVPGAHYVHLRKGKASAT